MTSEISTAVPIRVQHVSKQFGATVALNDISFEVGRGEVLGLLGPNGAGKTTLIRTILDIIKPDSGTVELFGRPFQPSDRNRVGYLPEERGLYPRQPVGKVLEYLGALKGLSGSAAKTAAAAWLERVGLGDVSEKKVEQLSKGNQQKVQFAATLLAEPSIVILDEPLSGLDPLGARQITNLIRGYAARGHTVVLSTHMMSMVEVLCTRVFMIARGQDVLQGELKSIKQRFATNSFRVSSNASYSACPFIDRVNAGGSDEEPVEIHLREPATGTELLGWLVTSGARVDSFERMPTPLDDIFVQVAETAAAR